MMMRVCVVCYEDNKTNVGQLRYSIRVNLLILFLGRPKCQFIETFKIPRGRAAYPQRPGPSLQRFQS